MILKNFTRLASTFVFITTAFAHIFGADTLTSIYFLLMALYLIRVSETL